MPPLIVPKLIKGFKKLPQAAFGASDNFNNRLSELSGKYNLLGLLEIFLKNTSKQSKLF